MKIRSAAASVAAALFLGALVPAFADSPEEQLAAASALIDARRYDEAARTLDAFLAANPTHPRAGAAALALGRARLERKQYDQAVAAYEKALAAAGRDGSSRDAAIAGPAQLGLGEAAIYAGQYARAAAALEAAVKTPLKPEQASIVHYWLGQANFELGRFAAAEAAYLKVNAASDLIDGAYFGAALAALRLNKNDVARERLRVVVDRYPQSQDRPQAQLLLARMDAEAKKWAEARRGFEAFLETDAARRDAALRLGAEEGLVGVLLEMKDYAAAAARLEATLARLPAGDPQRPRVLLSLGHSRYRQTQHEAALAAYDQAAKAADPAVAAEGLYWAGNAALALSRPAEAAPRFAQLAQRFPDHRLAARAQLKAGDALLAFKQTDAASAAYRAVVARYKDSPEAAEARKALVGLAGASEDPDQLLAALQNADLTSEERGRITLRLARLYLDRKQYEDAAARLGALVKTRPEPGIAAEAQYLLGVGFEGRQHAPPAAAALEEAVRLAPSAPWAADAQTRLAWLFLDLKRPADAERAASAALALQKDPEPQRQARLALVQAQLDQEKWDAALAGADALLAGSPPPETRAVVLFTRAWVSEKRGQDAQALWEQLARDYPQSPYAAEAPLRQGDALAKAGKHAEAAEKYAALLAAYPASPLAAQARFKRATALYNGNRPADAAAEWDALAADPAAGDTAPEALYWSGVALDKAGRKADAIERLTRLVTNYPTHTRVANAKVRLAALKAVNAPSAPSPAAGGAGGGG